MKNSRKIILVTVVLLLMSNFSKAQQKVKESKDKSLTIITAEVTYPKGYNRLTIFPNPAVDQINVQLNDKHWDGFNLEIYDWSGNRLISKLWKGESIDISQLNKGIYMLYLRRKNEVYSEKFLVR